MEGLELACSALPRIRPAVLPRRAPDSRLLRKRTAQFLRGGSCSTPRSVGPRAVAPQGRAEAGRPRGGEGHGLHLQGAGQHGPQSSRPDRIHAPLLGAFPARHEAVQRAREALHFVNAPILFFAQQRETTDEAHAGDIIGIPNHGTIRVGDTFTEGEVLKYQGIPNFAPELLRRVGLEDAMQDQAAQSRVARPGRGRRGPGLLPFAGINSRSSAWSERCSSTSCNRGCSRNMASTVRYEPVSVVAARWIETDNAETLRRFVERHRGRVAKDRDEALVYLPESQWALEQTPKDWPDLVVRVGPRKRMTRPARAAP